MEKAKGHSRRQGNNKRCKQTVMVSVFLSWPTCFHEGVVESPIAVPRCIQLSSSLCTTEGQTATRTEKVDKKISMRHWLTLF